MTSLTTAGSIEAALRDATAGDELAFTRIVAEYHGDMVRVAYGICGDRDLALDAVQSAWLIGWRKLGSVRDPARLRGWLVAVAANEARHVIRRRRRRTVVEIPATLVDDRTPDPSADISRLDMVNASGSSSWRPARPRNRRAPNRGHSGSATPTRAALGDRAALMNQHVPNGTSRRPWCLAGSRLRGRR